MHAPRIRVCPGWPQQQLIRPSLFTGGAPHAVPEEAGYETYKVGQLGCPAWDPPPAGRRSVKVSTTLLITPSLRETAATDSPKLSLPSRSQYYHMALRRLSAVSFGIRGDFL